MNYLQIYQNNTYEAREESGDLTTRQLQAVQTFQAVNKPAHNAEPDRQGVIPK